MSAQPANATQVLQTTPDTAQSEHAAPVDTLDSVLQENALLRQTLAQTQKLLEEQRIENKRLRGILSDAWDVIKRDTPDWLTELLESSSAA
ncbi:hypothetical protein PENSPDRAFT_649481 [Peniophora sp. CONT]|nr:hypothetical protein PENSPDRAFT_649481 [Peniophora sp. CONT]